MIICKSCGHHNREQDSFCASCGAFLEWSGERVNDGAPGQQAPPGGQQTAPGAGQGAPGTQPAGTQPAGGGQPWSPPAGQTPRSTPGQGGAWQAPAGQAPAGQSGPPAGSAQQAPPWGQPAPTGQTAQPWPPPGSGQPAATGRTSGPPPTTTSGGAWSPPAGGQPSGSQGQPPSNVYAQAGPGVQQQVPQPVTPQAVTPQTQQGQPTGPVLPGAQPQAIPPGTQWQPQTQRPATPTTQAQPMPAPGELVCPNCGAGNEPGRHFCRRCGVPLTGAAQSRPPGYDLSAGQRPAAMRQGSTGAGFWPGFRSFVIAMLLVVLVGSGLAFAALPSFRAAIANEVSSISRAVKRQVNPTYTATRPEEAQASSSLPGHGPQLAIDLVNNDYWAADTARDRQPVLTVKFASPTDLDYVIVTSGANPSYTALARPRDVQITYSDGTSQTITLRDDPKPVGYALSAHNVTSASLRVLTVYPSDRSSAVAIAELEFFRLS